MSLRDSQLTGRLRLRHLREVNEAIGEEMAEQRPRFQRLARKDSAPKVFSAFNLFPTPPDLADRVIELADIHYGQHVLEPSAGTGRLLDAIQRRFKHHVESGLVHHFSDLHIRVTAVEIDEAMCHHALTHQRFAVWVTATQADFLTWETTELFDRIVANPPFRRGVDVRHIEKMRTLLKPGGRLVAICANGSRRQRLFDEASQVIELPEGSFKSEGTNVSASIVVFNS